MFLGLLFLAPSIPVLFSGSARHGLRIFCGVLCAVGLLCLLLAYRTVKLFYPGAYLVTGGAWLIYLAPVVRGQIWSALLDLARLLFDEGSTVRQWVHEISNAAADLSTAVLSVTPADFFFASVGLAMIASGVWAGKQPLVFISATTADEIKRRIRRGT